MCHDRYDPTPGLFVRLWLLAALIVAVGVAWLAVIVAAVWWMMR